MAGEMAGSCSAAVSLATRFNEAPANWPGRCSTTRRRSRDPRASMRPRPIGRGDAILTPTIRKPGSASMRPRPIGRGDAHEDEGPQQGHLASMRPRPIGRGDPASAGAAASSTRRFNEAPANWPGRSIPWNHLMKERTGFNEAPANWPGRCLGCRQPDSGRGKLQ